MGRTGGLLVGEHEYRWPESFSVERPEEVEHFVEGRGLGLFLERICPSLEEYLGPYFTGEVSVFRLLESSVAGDPYSWLVIEVRPAEGVTALEAMERLRRFDEDILWPLYEEFPEAETKMAIHPAGIPDEIQEFMAARRIRDYEGGKTDGEEWV